MFATERAAREVGERDREERSDQTRLLITASGVGEARTRGSERTRRVGKVVGEGFVGVDAATFIEDDKSRG